MAKNPIPKPPTEENISKLLQSRFTAMEFLDDSDKSSITEVFLNIAKDVIAKPHLYVDQPRFPSDLEIASLARQWWNTNQLTQSQYNNIITGISDLFSGMTLKTESEITNVLQKHSSHDEMGFTTPYYFKVNAKDIPTYTKFFVHVAEVSRKNWDAIHKSK